VKLNQALIDVVYSKNGTGYRIQAGDLNLAGKSGTAQVVDISSREEYDEVRENLNLRDHAIFIGYAPFDDPRYSIAVIVENGESGGRVAGPIARDVLKELIDDI
jgi:Cell division protein FtsI/penicillin-binding protein 2